jgi:hypothetical protein
MLALGCGTAAPGEPREPPEPTTSQTPGARAADAPPTPSQADPLPEPVACRDAETCGTRGACALTDGACRPATQLHCAESLNCARFGACVIGPHGVCAALQDEHCIGPCKRWGRCEAVEGDCVLPGRSDIVARSCNWDRCDYGGNCCLAGSPSDCAEVCKSEGRCSVDRGRCVATKSDCAQWCGDADYCRFVEGQCITSKELVCTMQCGMDGRCDLAGTRCVATTAEHCRRSAVCQDHGRCAARGGACVTSAQGCRFHDGCGLRGLCTLRGGQCVAASDEDCQRSSGCQDVGRCVATSGTCE